MSLINEFSIQLYSVREETEKDFAGTLKRVAAIGYTGVEFAGYGGIPANEMKKLLDDCGMKSVGTHVGMNDLENRLDEQLAYNSELGTQYIICPGAPFDSRDDVLRNAEFFNKTVEKVNKAGMKFGYHNHDAEFKKHDSVYLMDILLSNTQPDVLLELDVYWAAYAGVEPVAYMQEHSDRTALLHIKQMLDYESKKCVDLNEGVLDFANMITEAKKLGVATFILEQEEFAVDAYTSLKNDYAHIMSL